MVKYQRKIKPVQGGFLVLRPSMQVYEELVNIVKKGDFAENTGWWAEGKGQTGLFYGSMTIQGKRCCGVKASSGFPVKFGEGNIAKYGTYFDPPALCWSKSNRQVYFHSTMMYFKKEMP